MRCHGFVENLNRSQCNIVRQNVKIFSSTLTQKVMWRKGLSFGPFSWLLLTSDVDTDVRWCSEIMSQKSHTKSYIASIRSTYVVVPPDGGWGWLIVASAFVCNLLADGTMYSFGLFLDEISQSLNTTKTTVAMANSLTTGCSFLFGKVISFNEFQMLFRYCVRREWL